MTFKKSFDCVLCAFLIAANASAGASIAATPAVTKKPVVAVAADSFAVTAAQCKQTIRAVNKLIHERFYNKNLAATDWTQYLSQHGPEIESAKNLRELSDRINAGIKTLKSSHCEFSTTNDEIYYFLNTMFSEFNKKIKAPMMDYTGAITGGVNCQYDKVRYVLDGSPAGDAGIRIGDQILKVDGKPLRGQSSFWGMSGRAVPVEIMRRDRKQVLTVKPELRNDYREYVAAIGKSVRTFKVPGGTVGYVHLWSGGALSHEAFELAMSGPLCFTDGLILDLRDGYGGNSISDLDCFYRSPVAFPEFWSTDRDGKKHLSRDYYDKPVVALINGGSRSGKELLAFSLKRTGRAKLVGERTAGAVVAGSLFPINSSSALYLAVFDAEVGGVRLEGLGVEPHLVVPAGCTQEGHDRQLAEATRLLIEQLHSEFKPAR